MPVSLPASLTTAALIGQPQSRMAQQDFKASTTLACFRTHPSDVLKAISLVYRLALCRGLLTVHAAVLNGFWTTAIPTSPAVRKQDQLLSTFARGGLVVESTQMRG